MSESGDEKAFRKKLSEYLLFASRYKSEDALKILIEHVWGNRDLVRGGWAPVLSSLRRYRRRLNIEYAEYLFIEAVIAINFRSKLFEARHPALAIAEEMGWPVETEKERKQAALQVRKLAARLDAKGLLWRYPRRRGDPEKARGTLYDLSPLFKALKEEAQKEDANRAARADRPDDSGEGEGDVE